jgi:hypothetical protein
MSYFYSKLFNKRFFCMMIFRASTSSSGNASYTQPNPVLFLAAPMAFKLMTISKKSGECEEAPR